MYVVNYTLKGYNRLHLYIDLSRDHLM